MSKKKRVYDLAKEYGMTGQELAAKLKGLGVSEIKSHMTAMDEFLLLRVQGMLEAHGLHTADTAEEPVAADDDLASMGLTIRRKKKKKKVVEEPAAVPEVAAEPAATEAPEVDSAPAESPADSPAVGVPAEVPTGSAAVEEPSSPTPEPQEAGAPETPVAEATTAPEAVTPEVVESAPAAAAPTPEEAPAPQAPVETPAPAAESTPPAPTPEPAAAPVAESAPEPPVEATAEPAEAPVASAPSEAAAEPEATPGSSVPADAPAAAVEAAPQTPAETPPAVQPAAIESTAPESTPVEAAPAASAEGAPAPAATEGEAPAAEGAATGPSIVRPSQKRRAGKVVGFVDLSKIKTNQPVRPDSRRLRSKDDVTPDVRPTMGHDRSRALMRGDGGSRGTLSATQLREREAGRFLRRGRPQPNQGRGGGGGRGRGRGRHQPKNTDSPFAGGVVRIEAPITIKKLAEGVALSASVILGRAINLMGLGVNLNTTLDDDSAMLLASEFSVDLDIRKEVAAEEALIQELQDAREEVVEDDKILRAPTVAFLGHVDHGKTTLLDTLRKSEVTKGESGGITQHLGAYQVTHGDGRKLTIIDTPGHEAFEAMRARGAQAVDVTVLVVAADDGIKPSTLKGIEHAQKAGTPIVVALNKCDKPEAQPEKVKTELAQRGLQPEEWGGEVPMIQISALQGTGLDELLEAVLLQGELLELNCHPDGPARGLVLEAEVQEGRGKVAYLLVEDGTLRPGDIILAGEGYGRVRSIHDDHGRGLEDAGPSFPIEVSGLSELPKVGDSFYVVDTLAKAKTVAEEIGRRNRQMSLAGRRAVTNENLTMTLGQQEKKAIPVLVKADVQGSLQAIEQQLEALKHDEVEVRVLHTGLGTVTESDVDRVATSQGARIIAFQVGINERAKSAADRSEVEITQYSVIYELLDDLRALMESSLAPEFREEVTGHIEVKRIFRSSKFGVIAGCQVLDGKVRKSDRVRVQRDGETIHTAPIAGLRREKDEVKEVREGFECGVTVKDFQDYQEGDVFESFKMVEVKRLLKI